MNSRIGMIVVPCAFALGAIAAPARAQDVSKIIALHSFEDLPALPATVADVIKRYGDVSAPEGRTEKGDLETEALRQRINGWMKPTGGPTQAEIAAMMSGGGRMTPAAGEAMGQLLQTAGPMTTELAEAVQTFGLKTMPPLRMAYEAKLDRIFKKYNPQIEHCLGLAERAGGSPCADPTPARDAAINAAGDAFLTDAGSAYAEYRRQLKLIAGRGEAAIDRATKSVGGSPPALIQSQFRGIRQNELNALLAGLTAETDLIRYVHDHAALPKQDAPAP